MGGSGFWEDLVYYVLVFLIMVAGGIFGVKGFICALALGCVLLLCMVVSEDSPEAQERLRANIDRAETEYRKELEAARQRREDRSLYDAVTAQDASGKLRRDVDRMLPDADDGTKANAAYDLLNDGTKFGNKY